MKVLCTVLYTFPMLLRRIIFFFNKQELAEFVIISYILMNVMFNLRVVLWEKFDYYHSQGLKVS